MGSFNVGCGLSNLSIDINDEVGFVILLPNFYKTYAQNIHGFNPESGTKYRIYSTDEFEVFSPPIYGKYDDYGNIRDIQSSPTTEMLEKIFNRPIETVVNSLGDRRDIYSSYGEIYKNYFPEESKLKGFSHPDEQILTNYGFVKVAENIYNFRGYSLIKSEDDLWSITTEDRSKTFGKRDNYSQISLLVSTFAEYTSMYPGFKEQDWDSIRLLHSASGMFFLKEVFDNMKSYVKEDPSYNKSFDRLTNDWNKYFDAQFNQDFGEGPDSFVKMMMANSLFPHYLKQIIALRPQDYEQLSVYKDSQEFLEIQNLVQIATVSNRLLVPSYVGEQFGNDEASRAMNAITDLILKARKDQENEDYEEEDD